MTCHKVIYLFVLLFGPSLVVSFKPGDAKIYGGLVTADPEAFPYQASLRLVDGHICGGAILDERHILTAAHCFYGKNEDGQYTQNKKIQKVVVGQVNLEITDESIHRSVAKIIKHPDFIIQSEFATTKNDIAILELKEPLDLAHPFVSQVKLSSNASEASACFVSGWGASEMRPISERLMFTTVEIFPTNQCLKGAEIQTDRLLCAGRDVESKHVSCTGDSGGPLICDQLLTGIASFGFECGNPDYKGVYTNVAYFHEWITKTIDPSRFKEEL